MFEDIVTTTIIEEYSKTFTNTYYPVLSVSTENSPISGFLEGQKVSIKGTADLSLFFNEDLKLANIGVVVELADCPKVNYFANYGELKFHEGILSLWETTNLNVMIELWEKTGCKETE